MKAVVGALIVVVGGLFGGIASQLPRSAAPPAAARAAEDVHLLGTDREPSGAPHAYVGTGLGGGFQFFDGDLPPDLRRVAVRISSVADPTGIEIWARRAGRADAYYRGEFTFSTDASDPATGTIRVAGDDQITMTYVDALGGGGGPALVQPRAPWRPGSAQPDARAVTFLNTDPQSPTVWGAWRAVAPHATVRIYSAATGGEPIASGPARADGSFSITTAPFPVPPPQLWVTATEPGQGESIRVRAGWAALTGRVVRPEAGNPPSWLAWAHLNKQSCDPNSVRCAFSPITDYHGRWSIDPSLSNWSGPGTYDLRLQQQTIKNPAAPGTWRSTAFGSPPLRTVTVSSSTTTTDVGDQLLLGPNVLGRVRAGALAVPEAQLWIEHPDGSVAPGGGYTREDGRFALHLTEGDFVLWLRPPVGCGGYRDPRIPIQVRNGVATPSNIDADIAIGSQVVPASVVPITAEQGSPAAVTVLAPSGELTVDLDGASGTGSISAGCASLGARPDLELVAPPVDLAATGVTFSAATVCQSYDPEALAQRGLTASQLELFHIETNGAATPITTARDVAGSRVCGRTTSFSPFALGRATGAPAPSPPTTTTTSTTTTTTTTPTSTSTTTTLQPTTTTTIRPTSTTTASPPTTARPSSSQEPAAPAPATSGYRMVTSAGVVHGFGRAAALGDAPVGASRAVDIESTPSGNGYWVVDAGGRVFSFGDAPYLGGSPALAGETVTSLSRTPSGRGYWLFTTTGRVVPFGDATFRGDMRDTRLNGPVLDSIPTPSGNGYYLVASDGGIFTFGDARFTGSMGGIPLNAPVQSLVPDPDGDGYWLVASDGGIFSFNASFYGSMGSTRLNRPITGMVGAARGYLMVAEDGGIFSFGEAAFHGSLGANPPPEPVEAVSALP